MRGRPDSVVRTDRRRFLQLLTHATGWLLCGLPGRAHALTSAIEIHRGTRNTRLGAVGAGLRRLRPAYPPYKPYAGRARIALGALAATPGRPLIVVLQGDVGPRGRAEAQGAELSRAAVGRLLYFANGDTGKSDDAPYKLRAAPSAGALYAGELYVVAREVEGLSRAIYYYDVGQHALVGVRDAFEDRDLAAALADPAAATAPALVLVTNLFARYERRYANRGYRYALIDTGHIGENLRLAAASGAIAETRMPQFDDDRLNRLLGIDGREEAVCAVHVLGPWARSAAGDGSFAKAFVEKGPQAAAALPPDATPTQRYHEASKLVAAARASAASAVASALGSSEIAEPAAASQEASAAFDRATVEHHIAGRRSPRAFQRRSIERDALVSLLHVSISPARAGRQQGAVDLQVVISRVNGVEPGIHRYDPGRRRLVMTRRAELSGTMARMCLGQARAADAAAVVLMVGRIEEIVGREGQRAYRDLLIEAGEIGERLYLGARALGLVARNLAAYYDDELNELVGLDGRRLAVVHLTVVGLEA